MTVVLRPAQPLDAGAIGEILSDFVEETPWMPCLHSRAEDLSFADRMIARGWVSVLEAASHVVGFLARDGADVVALYLRADRRGQGFGTRLLDQAKAEQGRLALWTFEANTGAQRFYLRQGFVETNRTDGAGNDEGLPDIHFEWRKETT